MVEERAMYTLDHGTNKTPLRDGVILKIGRANSNDIVCDDSAASRFHAEIKLEGGQVTLRDQESTNGTSLNGALVKPWIWNILAPGDEFAIGAWVATLSEGQVTSSGGTDAKLRRPTVDPAGPSSAYETTSAMTIPTDLLP